MNGYMQPVYGTPIQPPQGFMIVPTGVPGMMPGAYNSAAQIPTTPVDTFDAGYAKRQAEEEIAKIAQTIQTSGVGSPEAELANIDAQVGLLLEQRDLVRLNVPYAARNKAYSEKVMPLLQGVAPQAVNGITAAPTTVPAAAQPGQAAPATTTAQPAAPVAQAQPATVAAQVLPGGLGVDPTSGLLVTAETDPTTKQPVLDTATQQPKTRPLTFAEASTLPVFAKPDANGDGTQEIVVKQNGQELPLTNVAIPQGDPAKPNDIQVNPQDQAVMLNGAPLNASQLLFKPANFAQAQAVSTYDPQTGQVVQQPVQQGAASNAAAGAQPGQPAASQVNPQQIEAILTQATDPAIAAQAAAQVNQAIQTAVGNEGLNNPNIAGSTAIATALTTIASNAQHPLQGQALDGLTRLEVNNNTSAAKKKKASALTSYQKATAILNAKPGQKNSPLPADPTQAAALKSVALGSLQMIQGAPGAQKDGKLDKAIAAAIKVGVQPPVNSMPAGAGAPGQRLTAFA
jgi:hypothetical protein